MSALSLQARETSGTTWYWVWFVQCHSTRSKKVLRSAGANATWDSSPMNIRSTWHWLEQDLDSLSLETSTCWAAVQCGKVSWIIAINATALLMPISSFHPETEYYSVDNHLSISHHTHHPTDKKYGSNVVHHIRTYSKECSDTTVVIGSKHISSETTSTSPNNDKNLLYLLCK